MQIKGMCMLRAEVMECYGILKDFSRAGFFETDHHKTLFRQLQYSINDGTLIALTGLIGSGKTTMLRRLQERLEEKKGIIVSKALDIEKEKTTIPTLITALFYDLSGDLNYQIPKLREKRERELQQLMRKKIIVLIIDEAHDLHGNTLTGLKRLMELARDSQGILSIVLAGHPKLRNDLTGARLEEIGYRTRILPLDAMQGHLRAYVQWLLKECCSQEQNTDVIITADAIDYLVEHLHTPLQIEQHLRTSLERAFIVGGEPVNIEILQSTLSPRMNDLEPTLIRHGYSGKVLSEQLHMRKSEVHKFLTGQLEPAHQQEVLSNMRTIGMPV